MAYPPPYPSGGSGYPGQTTQYPPQPQSTSTPWGPGGGGGMLMPGSGPMPYPTQSGNIGFGGPTSGYPPGPGPIPYPSGQPPRYPPGPGAVPGYPPSVGQTGPGYPSGPSYPPAPLGNTPGYPPMGGMPGYLPGNPPPGPAPYPSGPTQPQYPPSQQPYPSSGPGYSVPSTKPVPSNVSRQSQTSITKKMSEMSIPKLPRTEGTLKPSRNFNAEKDASTLRTAMKGFGTDEKAIINVLGNRSNEQRQLIKTQFKTMYGRDLIKDLKSELSGNFEDVILSLMMLPLEYDTNELHKGIQGLGTDESVLIEILCSRSNEEIEAIKRQYKKEFGKSLEQDITGDTSGHFKRLLVSLVTASRDRDGPINSDRARKDAQALYAAGEAKWGTDESKFNEILCSRSHSHLHAVFEEYSKICKYDIESSISREMSGDLKDGMISLVKCVRDIPGFFAEKLYTSMKGLGTDDRTLIRVMVSRCEVDMVQIKLAFQKKYHKTLESFIKGDTSGDYRRILLAIADEPY